MSKSTVIFNVKAEFANQFAESLGKAYGLVTEQYLQNCEYYKEYSCPERLPFNNWKKMNQREGEGIVFENQNALVTIDSDYIRIFCLELAKLNLECPFFCDVNYYQRNADGEFHMRVQFFPDDKVIGWRVFSTLNVSRPGNCTITCPSCGKVYPDEAPDDWFDIYYCPNCEESLHIRDHYDIEAAGGFVEYNEDFGWIDC